MKIEKGREKSRGFRQLASIAGSAILLLLAVAAFAGASLSFADRTGAREEETLEKAITRASVQCYAIEGRYPPSVEYLEDNYGIQINRKKYNVFYSGFASNVMPEVTVVPAGQ